MRLTPRVAVVLGLLFAPAAFAQTTGKAGSGGTAAPPPAAPAPAAAPAKPAARRPSLPRRPRPRRPSPRHRPRWLPRRPLPRRRARRAHPRRDARARRPGAPHAHDRRRRRRPRQDRRPRDLADHPRARRRHDDLDQAGGEPDRDHQRRRRRMEVRLPRLPARAGANQLRPPDARPAAEHLQPVDAAPPCRRGTRRIRAPRAASSAPTRSAPTGRPGTQWHSPTRVPGYLYTTWEYTNTVHGPWAQLNFTYGNSRAMATVIVDSYSQTDGGYKHLQAQQGIDQAFLTLNFPDALGELGTLTWNIGTFQNRYGTMGKYDGGMYETYLFGRTHITGETLTANLTNIDSAGDWAFSVEDGFGAKYDLVPYLNNPVLPRAVELPVGLQQRQAVPVRPRRGVPPVRRAGAAGLDVRPSRSRRREVPEDVDLRRALPLHLDARRQLEPDQLHAGDGLELRAALAGADPGEHGDRRRRGAVRGRRVRRRLRSPSRTSTRATSTRSPTPSRSSTRTAATSSSRTSSARRTTRTPASTTARRTRPAPSTTSRSSTRSASARWRATPRTSGATDRISW